ncbi:MAG: NAD(P)H-hydrate epimerase [Trueperaceae bacterium]|nr:NAD(P)H-hydrate epimerase [Trueperaceae bacterium]
MSDASFPTIAWNDVPKLSASQMQQLAMLATGKYGLDIRLIVEHTGRNLAELVNHFAPEGPVLIAAGRGNNGSGGLATARLLASQQRPVWVVPTHEAENYSGITKEQLELLKHYPSARVRSSLPKMKFTCVIDAAIGTQLEGPPRGRTLDVITVLNNLSSAGSCVISLDTPTGMVADTGEVPGEVVNATMTMALALPKRGVEPGTAAGDIYIGDFGVPPGVFEDMNLTAPKFTSFLTKVIP